MRLHECIVEKPKESPGNTQKTKKIRGKTLIGAQIFVPAGSGKRWPLVVDRRRRMTGGDAGTSRPESDRETRRERQIWPESYLPVLGRELFVDGGCCSSPAENDQRRERES
ncbi:hypothetical protein SLA2020_265610 [Shorea laevis]